MTYKLLAVDLDGTLLRRDGSIHPRDLGAIRELQRAGVPVTIATGRLYSGSREAAQTIQADGPVACMDGSHIVDARDHASLVHTAISGADALLLREILEKHDATSFLFAQDSIVHDEAGAPFVPYVRTWSTNILAVDRVTAHPHWEHQSGVLGVVALGATERILAAVAALEAELAHAAHVVSFAVQRLDDMHALVCRAVGATKGTAVAWLAEHHGCSLEDVVVVGDWLNDVPMFRVAGRSFVMAHAPEEVKREASDELSESSVEGGGVAEAIARAWG